MTFFCMVLNKFTLNFKNKHYQKEYHQQTDKYHKKINNVYGIIFMVFSVLINAEVYLFTSENLVIITALLPLIIEAIALYKNSKLTSQANYFMFLAIIAHIVLSVFLQFQKFSEAINKEQNFIFGSLNGLIVGIVSSGLQQWYLKELIIIIYIFMTFLPIITVFTFSDCIPFVPIIIILIILSNIVSYYKEMQIKIQFYEQIVAKDSIQDLKNLLQTNIPQSVFVVSQKKKNNCNEKNQQNVNKIQNPNNNLNQYKIDLENSIQLDDELEINFQNKYFTDYQQKYKFSNDITSFLKQVKITQGSQANIQSNFLKIQQDQLNYNKTLFTPHNENTQQNSILDIIIQQIRATAHDQAQLNDTSQRQRRITIAQDKGFQLDNMKEFFNCQYTIETINKQQIQNKRVEQNKEKKSSSPKKKKKNGNNNIFSEYRIFGRTLSQISIKNFSSNTNTPRTTIQNEFAFQNSNTLQNPNLNKLYNSTLKSSPKPHPTDELISNPYYNKAQEIRRKSNTVQAYIGNKLSNNSSKLAQISPLSNFLANCNPSAIRKYQQYQQNQTPKKSFPSQNQVSLQPAINNIQQPNLEFFQQDQFNFQQQSSKAIIRQTNMSLGKHDNESIYNKQSRQSITSQKFKRNLRNSINKSQQEGDNSSKRNSTITQQQMNSMNNQQSINNFNSKTNSKSDTTILNRIQSTLNFDIQLVKCQWEENDAVMVIMNDISEKMMNLRQKEGDKYKDEMLSTVTHNLKTPLNSMILLINKLLKKDKKNKDLKIISQSSYMLLSMIMDILDYQCIKRKTFKLQIEAFDLIEILKEVKQLYLIQAEVKGLEINIINNIKNPDLQLVLQDIDRIKQILINLVGNAIKFTKKGSITIIVSIDSSNQYKTQKNIIYPSSKNIDPIQQNPPPPPQIQPSQMTLQDGLYLSEEDIDKSPKLNNYQRIFQNNGVISIQVKDTGQGIDEALQSNLFKIFATHEHNNGSTKHGVGLGLTVCKKIAKLIGPSRDILLDSSPGKGSAFTFFIYQNLLTSPKQYNSELKNQISPIVISTSQDQKSLPQKQKQIYESDQAQQVPMFSAMKNSHQLLPINSPSTIVELRSNSRLSTQRINDQNNIQNIDSPLLKSDGIETGNTPRNQISIIQHRSSDASLNQGKDDNNTQKRKTSAFKSLEQSKRKKSSKLFQGSQISLFLDLNNPLPESKQFQQQYLSSFLNFTPRSGFNQQLSQQTTATLNNINQKLLTKRDSEFNDQNQLSSLRFITLNNNGIASPNITSSNMIIGKDKDFSKQLIKQRQQKNSFNDEDDDILFKSGEINDNVLSETFNKTPEKITNRNTENSPNQSQNTKPIIQPPKKSLFNLDSKNLIAQKSNPNLQNNLQLQPQCSISISIDRHLNNYASNNLLATQIDCGNKYEEKFNNDENIDYDENCKPLKYIDSQSNIALESYRQNLINKKNTPTKIEVDQYFINKNREYYMSDSEAIPYSDQQIIENDKESYSDNIQDENSDNNNEDSINEDDDYDIDNSKDIDEVEEDDDESKEDDENINMEGLFQNTINALIVDDTPFNILVLKAFFQNCKNIKFSQAFDGKEALELYKENRYDLIFMDINMPVMDGYESITLIRQFEQEENLKECVIFAVTAQDQIKDIQKCIDCGANGHIPKPVKISLLYSSLYQYFKRR